MRIPLRVVLFGCVLWLAGSSEGCSIEPFAGGSASSLPKQIAASYRVVECVITDGQKRVKLKKPIQYFVSADAAGRVYEKSAAGRVIVFENRWTDKRGHHALVWVYGGPYGYHIIRPWVKTQPALRLVWRRRDLREVEKSWRPKPKAMPYARCPLIRTPAVTR